MSAVQFGVLTTIEMATAVLIYIPVAYLADRGRKKPFVLITFILFTCFPLVLMFCRVFRMARAGVCRARAQGVRRADPQGPDRGPVAGSEQGRHVRPVLPHAGRRGCRWPPSAAHFCGR
ncbi:MAG: hypothetical protein MZV70_65455 [Desulfobacterales bacterium]|nr:hypothetical protein [Desulfobacterales bacterium]